jgi:hypothetical protein
MDRNEKLAMLAYEYELIKDLRLKGKVIEVLANEVPDYFFTVAASSTGKYHPSYALGDGGLVRHTKAAVRIAYELFRIFDFSPVEEDHIIAAIILHDAWKHGEVDGGYTVTAHPLVASKHFQEAFAGVMGEGDLTNVTGAISTHMGQWNKDYKTGKEVLPTPKTKMGHFIHLCDYLASRKMIEVNWDAGVTPR